MRVGACVNILEHRTLPLIFTEGRTRCTEGTSDRGKKIKMFELYGVNKDGMVYRSPPPRRKEVDILEVIR